MSTTPTPTIEQFINAEYTVVPGFSLADDPMITVENAVAVEPFYFDVDVRTFETLMGEALGNDDAEEECAHKLQAVANELDETHGIIL